jgi:hypothetical protein
MYWESAFFEAQSIISSHAIQLKITKPVVELSAKFNKHWNSTRFNQSKVYDQFPTTLSDLAYV